MSNTQLDVGSLVSTGLWVFGLAILIAAVSYAYWSAWLNDRALSQELGDTRTQSGLLLGLLLISIGLIGIGKTWWSQLPAVGLLLICLAILLHLWLRHQTPPPVQSDLNNE